MKTAEDYWYEFSNHSTGTITEAKFKSAIRRCQQELMGQIEYQNKEAKEDHNSRDNLPSLEEWIAYVQKVRIEVHNKAIDEAIVKVDDLLLASDPMFGVALYAVKKEIESLKH